MGEPRENIIHPCAPQNMFRTTSLQPDHLISTTAQRSRRLYLQKVSFKMLLLLPPLLLLPLLLIGRGRSLVS